jgi:hypothetical protein
MEKYADNATYVMRENAHIYPHMIYWVSNFISCNSKELHNFIHFQLKIHLQRAFNKSFSICIIDNVNIPINLPEDLKIEITLAGRSISN